MSDIFIDGIGLSGYRSFDEVQRIRPFKKINLFIGQNNSGKSNILLFLKNHYKNVIESVYSSDKNSSTQPEEVESDNKKDFFAPLDYHSKGKTTYNSISVNIAFRKEIIENFLASVEENYKKNKDSAYYTLIHKHFAQIKFVFEKLLKSDILPDKELIWLSVENGQKIVVKENEYKEAVISKIPSEVFNKCEKLFIGYRWPNFYQNIDKKLINELKNMNFCAISVINGDSQYRRLFIESFLNFIAIFVINESKSNTLKIDMIPAIRKIGEAGTTPDDLSGIGIIDRLSQLQHPNDVSEYKNKKEKFDKINEFLQTLINKDKATIEIPHDKSDILVNIDDRTLPISSLGTGIHEVIILAAAATVLENQVICMEEPELHLHPLLQKKLIRYLQENTNNQYFITTHSAHFIDTPDAALFHVRHENGQSIVESVTTDNSKFSICSELGYKPSDLLQSNCIIWVEGPSDRIYLNYWIKLFNASLQEGIHYSIMFYGGSLISHLSISDSEINDSLQKKIDEVIDEKKDEVIKNLIPLIKINRNTVIMCDSDKSNDNDPLKPHQQRIEEESKKEKINGFVWITDGREIENYIDPDIILETIKKVYPNSKCESLVRKGINDDFLKYKYKNDKGEEKETKAKKKRIAKKIVERNQCFDTIANPELKDKLKAKMDKLVKVIKKSNHLEFDKTP